MARSRIIYSILFLSSLYFVYFYGGTVPWALFIIATALPVVSFTYLAITYYSLKYFESCPDRTYIKGETLVYKCMFANDLRIPFIYLRIFIQTPGTVVSGKPDIKNESIVSGRNKKMEYRIKCGYRGRYDIGILRIEFRDFLNLFELRLRKSNFISIIVYPRIRVMDGSIREGMTPSDFRVALFNKSKGEESLLNLRDYAYGDSSRLIHWKLSARMQRLIITDKESTLDSRVVMAIDLRKSNFHPSQRIVHEDRLVEEIVSTAHYFLARSIPVDLVYYKQGLSVWHGASMQDFDRLYNLLAEIEFDSDTGIEKVLYSILGEENSNNTIFVFSTRLTKGLYETLTKIHASDKRIFVRYCAMDARDEEVYNYRRLLARQGIIIDMLEEENEDPDTYDDGKYIDENAG
ncbi:MAG: DUF58 domain-containing protein [Clostridia bacterium]|nr:DUF58 domain-containing protein [Clostridia bacterium]